MAARWFDAWVQRGPFTSRDLGRYRILYCSLLVLLAPSITWLAPYPASFFDPPPGPFQALSAFPPGWMLVIVQVLLYVSLAATLLGLYTTFSSIALFLSMIAAYGLTYSVGKIDHGMLMVAVPLIFAFARWGDSLSIDALRRRPGDGRAAVVAPDDPAGQQQWPVRVFGVVVGLTFVTAALPKLLGGWLSLSTQATYGYQVRSDFASNRNSLLADWLASVRVPALWELLDWTTVLLEGLIFLAILSWKSWRVGLAALVLFHLGIGLSLGIWFVGNVIAYAAFVAWSRVPLPAVRLSPTSARRLVLAAPALVLALAGLTWWTISLRGALNDLIDATIVIVAAVVAAGYLFSQARLLLAHRRAGRTQLAEAR